MSFSSRSSADVARLPEQPLSQAVAVWFYPFLLASCNAAIDGFPTASRSSPCTPLPAALPPEVARWHHGGSLRLGRAVATRPRGTETRRIRFPSSRQHWRF